MAKTLPDGNDLRRQASFAQQELAPGNIKTALQYVIADYPDPSPWDDIEWLVQAGRFDQAIKRARQRSAPVERLGGLLAAATGMLDRNDRTRATRIVDDVERQLPSMVIDENDLYAGLLPGIAAEIRVRLGQTERAARLLAKPGGESLNALLTIAGKYPEAASLREQAWREAERLDVLLVWQLLLNDAKSRGDKADLWRAAQRASRKMDAEIRHEDLDSAISLARVLLEAGSPDLGVSLARQWRRLVQGKEARQQFNIIKTMLPLLVGLALDEDVQLAANSVSNIVDRSQCLSEAAEEYFSIGRNDIARTLDAEALRLAKSSPAAEPKQEAERDAALHYVAVARAGRGDIQGALDVAVQLRDERRAREVIFYIVRRAIDNGHGPIAAPAIDAMEQQGNVDQNASLLLQAASYWYEVGEEEGARRSLAQALKTAEERRSTLAVGDAGVAAELLWRIDGDGKAQGLLDIVDKLQVNDPGSIDHLVEFIRPVSPAVAVQLAGRQVQVERRMMELANIAVQIAEAKK